MKIYLTSSQYWIQWLRNKTGCELMQKMRAYKSLECFMSFFYFLINVGGSKHLLTFGQV